MRPIARNMHLTRLANRMEYSVFVIGFKFIIALIQNQNSPFTQMKELSVNWK